MKKRAVIIGINGAPYELMENLSDKGVMPNFHRRLFQRILLLKI